MGQETEFLEWRRLKSLQQFYYAAEGKQYTREKKERNNTDELLREHENYMVGKGFVFAEKDIKLPNGEIYEL